MKRYLRLITIGIALFTSIVACNKEIPTELTLSTTSISANKEGGSQVINFNTNKNWTAQSSASWCKLTSTSGDSSVKSVNVFIEANPNYEERSCTVVITVEELSETVTVKQSPNLGLIVSPISYNLTNSAQEIEVEIKTNIEYSISIDAACKDWISELGTKALSSNKVRFAIASNETYDSREGKITISQKNGSLMDTVTIKQGQNDGLFVTIPDYEISNAEHTLTVEVKANVDYVVIPNADWIKYVSTKSLNSTNISLRILENPTYDERTGTVTVIQKGGSLTGTITIKQDQRYGLMVSPSSFKLSKEEQDIEINIKHNVDYNVVIPDDSKSWISIKESAETKSLSDKLLFLHVGQNDNYESRGTTVTVKQKDGSLCETIEIIQAQTDVILVETSKVAVSPMGGTFDISYESNIETEIVIPCEWIHLTETKGLVQRMRTINIDSNLAKSERKENIIIRGGSTEVTIEIVQSAPKDGEYYSPEYGKLLDALSTVQMDTITTAKVIGYINGQDFKALNNLPKLSYLDLSEATCINEVIPDEAFSGNQILETIILPDSISGIGNSAFRFCTSLSLLTLPASLVSIGSYAFYGCEKMTGQLIIPENLYYIGSYAFASCTGLTGDLLFPESMYSIGSYAFSGCGGLNGKLQFPSFKRLYLGSYAFNDCKNFAGDLIITSNVNLGSHTFSRAGCTGSLYVYSAGFYAFIEFVVGENAIFEDNLTETDCTGRDMKINGYLYLGKNLSILGSQDFMSIHCTKVYCAALIPPVCTSDNSISLYGKTLYVPIGRAEAYSKAEGWNRAKEIIETDFSEIDKEPKN